MQYRVKPNLIESKASGTMILVYPACSFEEGKALLVDDCGYLKAEPTYVSLITLTA